MFRIHFLINKLKQFDKQALTLVLLGAFVALSIILNSFAIRLDFSRNQAYSLSPATKTIIKKLEKPVTLTFYVSGELPTRLIPLKGDVTDLLSEYRKLNSSKIMVKIVDPKQDPKIAEEAKQAGIPELQFSQLEKDKYQIANAYFGLSISYDQKNEIIPQLTDITNIEYNITSLIYRVSKKTFPRIATIAMPQSSSSNPQEDSYYIFRSLIASQYELQPLDFTEETETIGKNNAVVLLFDEGAIPFSDKQINTLNTYVNDGGNLIAFSDGVRVSEDMSVSSSSSTLSKLLKIYGMEVEPNLVLSSSAEYVNFGNSMVQFMTPYPFWIKTNSFEEKSSSIFANVNQVTFPWTSSIQIVKKKNIFTRALITSSDKSWEQKTTFALNPQEIPQPQIKDLHSFILAAQSDINKGGKIILIPTSRFVDARYLSRTSGNIDLIFNLIDNLASSGALSGIRSRAVTFQPLPEISQLQKDIFKYGNMLLFPGILAIIGSVQLVRRTRRSQKN